MEEKKFTKIKSEPEPVNYVDTLTKEQDAQKSLMKTWNDDTNWRLRARKILGVLVPAVLFGEILFVGCLVYHAVFQPIEGVAVKDYQILVSAFSVGVVAQTAYVFNIMVKWIFSEVKYDSHPLVTKNGAK